MIRVKFAGGRACGKTAYLNQLIDEMRSRGYSVYVMGQDDNKLPPRVQELYDDRPDAALLDEAKRVARNIQARKDAEEVVKLCGEQPPHFWRSLAELSQEKTGDPQPPAPPAGESGCAMTDDEAHAFERFTTIRFGKHSGRKVLDIVHDDPEYMTWLADNAFDLEFRKTCVKYVRSIRFRDRGQ